MLEKRILFILLETLFYGKCNILLIVKFAKLETESPHVWSRCIWLN